MPLLFHPTVFDNIKIALENQIYDYDNLDGVLVVTDRSDLLNLALMSREFSLAFKLTGGLNVTSEILLQSTVKDLGDEILETPGSDPGCSLFLRFYLEIEDVNEQCPTIEEILTRIWGPEFQPVQSLSFRYGQTADTYNNCVELQFKRQITEEQMEDLPNLLKFLLQSAEELEEV
ncbi:hypothetical protein [Paenibacillus sp. FSL R7-0337]|uniref:hypothetical protein n=1 Tax=Paenibacillus sp. FSL P4-0338 TaxID=2921635 RepID=UPI00211711E7|nr:hypothetical protein [Paenibacillus sp. FSL R7-0337]